MPAARLLLVEDRESLRRMLARALSGEGFTVVEARDGEEAMARLDSESFDLVLTDLKLPGASGLEVLAHARARDAPPQVVVLTAYGTVGAAVEAMKIGAADFLEKPVEIEDLLALVSSLTGAPEPASRFAPPGGPTIVVGHPRMRAALRLLERVAPTESTVLLTGESGTGKEIFARALHALSPRRGGPFVAVNCAAIPETLLENELFGHEPGAFTGASRRQLGRFEAAAGGTLLLDEIAELPPGVQAKVLRVLEEKSFERVGGGTTRHADVRLIAATNRDLEAMVERGSFRADLFFRLDVFPIEIPPLRDRREEIAPLAAYLLGEISARLGVETPRLSRAAEKFLEAQEWPGNVRQLGNVLERATILHERPGPIEEGELAPLLRPLTGERERFRRALTEAGGDKRRAAEILGVSYRTLLRRVRELDLAGIPRYRE